MDIKELRYFVELVQQQSFTRAAEKLFVTQPTISKMIRQLEAQLGQPLLIREGHRFRLTAGGQILFERGQVIVAQMAQLTAQLADLQSLQQGHLRLGIPPMVGHLYADWISAYRRTYPAIELSLVEYGGRQLEQAVLAGELDLAITMLPTSEPNGLQYLALAQYPMQVVLPNQPRWQGTGALHISALKDEALLLYSHAFTLSERLEQACQNAGFCPQVAARSSQWDFLIAMVKSHMGVAFLPAPVCQQVNSQGLLLRPLAPPLDWRLGVIWPKERYLSRSAQAWLDLCRQRHPLGHQ